MKTFTVDIRRRENGRLITGFAFVNARTPKEAKDRAKSLIGASEWQFVFTATPSTPGELAQVGHFDTVDLRP